MKDRAARLRSLFEIDMHPLRCQSAVPVHSGSGLSVTRLEFRNGADEAVRGIFCRPAAAEGPLPAVLVIHAHGDRHDIGADELIQGRSALDGPLGPALAARGIASLCLDMPCFGMRSGHSEAALSKALLWEGRSLAGQMLGECRAALDWLAAQPELRADRIGVFGISMGATLGYWLAAVDPRIRALVQECCLADFRTLIAMGAHDLHGPYLTIPGLLPLAANGTIAGMIAPRAQFVGLGDRDPLTPPAAADTALTQLRAAYASAGGRLVIHREPEAGHQETPAMRAAALAFLTAELA
ncbi:MAG: CocE/NonD family hydrolase [Pseudorhodobacter sp.]|nr:CocE/NonD family hydrolase [Pseudorhodobacter sp.]